MNTIITYEAFCKAFKAGEEEREQAELMLFIQDWIISVANNSGGIYSDQSLDTLYHRMPRALQSQGGMKDALSYIVDEVMDACKHIFNSMREKILRENVLLPIHKVKEVNSYGINWLSRRPGNTIREKMSGSASIMAVQRRMSLDTGENRLLLAFVKEVRELLQDKIDCAKEYVSYSEEDFYQNMSVFLRTEGIDEIKRWENLPPNNTLLSDNYYKKVWKAWNDLKDLDDRIERISQQMDENLTTIFLVELLLEAKKYFAFPQVPLRVDYDDYQVDIASNVFFGVGENDKRIRIVRENMDKSRTAEEMWDKIRIEYGQKVFEAEIDERILSLKKDGEILWSIRLQAFNIRNTVLRIIDELGVESKFTYQIDRKCDRIRVRNMIMDLFTVYPEYIRDESGESVYDCFRFRMLQQKFVNQEDDDEREYDVMCENSDAVLFLKNETTKTETFTMASAIDSGSHKQMSALFAMLEENMRSENMWADALSFAFPDIFNEFQLSLVHKTARLVFHQVYAFPRSIGIAFYFQYFTYLGTSRSAIDFSSSFTPGDFVLVADLVDDEISFTLLQGVYEKQVAKELDESRGIVWERHPTVSVSCESAVESIKKLLSQKGCERPGILYKIFGKEGIETDCDGLVCMYDSDGPDENYFRVTNEVAQILESEKIDITEKVENFLQTRRELTGKCRVHIFSLSKTLQYNGERNYQVYQSSDVLFGYDRYLKLQKKISMPLWRDHLPDLSIKQLYGKFDLVSDETILPTFNEVQDIRINNRFTLVKNRKIYRFQLVQNDVNRRMRYEAVVKHSVFPLKEDIECKLKMTYRYGNSEPYELKFIPVDKKKAGFTEANVEWNLQKDYEYMGLAYPEFPQPRSWDEVQNYPDRFSDGTIDLTQWIANNLLAMKIPYRVVSLRKQGEGWQKRGHSYENNAILNLDGEECVVKFILNEKEFEKDMDEVSFEIKEIEKKERYTMFFRNGSWRQNQDGSYYRFEEMYYNGERIFVAFFGNNFVDKTEFYPYLDAVSFELRPYKDKKYTAINIRSVYKYGDSDRKEYRAVYIRRGNCPREEITSKKMFFAMYTVFSDEKSILRDRGCPVQLKTAFEYSLDSWLSLYRKCDNKYIKNKLFTMLSLVAVDIGDQYYDIADQLVNEWLQDPKSVNDYVGYALGTYSSEKQRKLFSEVIKLDTEKTIGILAKAAWRYRDFIFNIPDTAAIYYFIQAIDILIRDSIVVLNELKQTRKYNSQCLRRMGRCMEYILAVFRLRENARSEICRTISLNELHMQNLYSCVEKLIDSGIIVKTYLQLKVDKKRDTVATDISDLLFAMLVYITGDASEADIKISGIEVEEM